MTDQPSGIEAALGYATRHHSTTKTVEIDDAGSSLIVVDHHPDRELEVLDLQGRMAAPRDSKGVAQLHTADALVEWTNRNAGPGPYDLYADLRGFLAVVILDPQREGEPSWQEHRGVFAARRHPSWERWRNITGDLLAQADFAAHVQTCAADIAEPAALDMLEIAETLNLNVGAKISSAVRQRDGQRHLIFDETVEARAGFERELTIPETMKLHVPIFEGAEPTTVPARLLYRAVNGAVGFIVQIIDPDDIERAAFQSLVEAAGTDLGTVPIWGVPASSGR